MNIRAQKTGIPIIVLLLFAIYPEVAAGREQNEKAKYGLKSEDYVLPPNAMELVLDYAFPSAEDENRGVYLADPQGFCVSPDGFVFISDIRNCEVYVFNLAGKNQRTIGRFGQGPGEFMMPKQLAILNNQLIVRDIGNRRIQFFDSFGKYSGGFKVFRDYNALVTCGGRIYGIPNVYTIPHEGINRCLIDELDSEGRVARSFGALMDVNADIMLLDMAFAADGIGKELWVSFMCFPIVRRYSLNGDLLGEFRFSYGISNKKESFNKRKLAQPENFAKVQYYFITSAIHATARGLYILGSSERRLDIILMAPNGRMKGFYWLPLEKKMSCFGLFVLEEEAGTRFYVLDGLSAKVEVYSIK